MYVAMGALSAEQKTKIAGMLPPWYSLEFQRCWADETNLDYPHCKELNEMHAQFSTEDADEMDALVDERVQILSEKQAFTYVALSAGAGLALGILIGVGLAGR
jgi:hypothetical protein